MVSAFGPTSMVKNTNIDLLESFFYIPIIALLGTYLFRRMYTRTMTKTVELSISGKFTFDFGLPLVVIFIYHVKLETVAS